MAGINWDEVPPLAAGGSGIDWSKVPDKKKPREPDAFDKALIAGGGLAGDEGFFDNLRTGVGKAFSDVGLGAQQLAASAGFGDKEALNREAAEREKRDAALMATGGGKVGKYGTDIAMSLAPFGAATKAATFLPKVKGAVGVAQKFLPAALGGAAQELVTPDEDYDPLWQAAKGAAFGAGGEGVGRLVGRGLSPMQSKIEPYLAGHLDNLKALPSKLAADITDNRTVKALTNALSMTPLGGGVQASRRANKEAMTEAITAAAGSPMKQATPEGLAKLESTLKSKYDDFDIGPNISLADIPAELRPTLDKLLAESKLAGKGSGEKTLRSAIEGSMRDVPGTPAGGILLPNGKMSIPAVAPSKAPVEISPQELLDLRSRASRNAFSATDSLDRTANHAVKDVLEDAMFKNLPPEKREAFEALNKQWATWERIKGAGVKGEHDTIRPEDYLRQLSKSRQIAPRTDLDKMVVSAERVMPTPSLAENRSLMTRVLTGAAPFGVLAGGALGGPAGIAGAAGSLALARKLLATPGGGRYLTGQAESTVGKALQSEKMRELLRQLGYTAGTNLTD